jgi:hypothetical protein
VYTHNVTQLFSGLALAEFFVTIALNLLSSNTHLHQVVNVPPLVGRKALDEGADLGGQIWFEFCITDS